MSPKYPQTPGSIGCARSDIDVASVGARRGKQGRRQDGMSRLAVFVLVGFHIQDDFLTQYL